MSDWDILNELFNEKALIPTESYYLKTKVVLKEPDASGSSVEIMNIPSDTFVIDLDKNFSNEKLFSRSDSKGFCKRADFMLISVEKQCVLFIEMKQSSSATRLSIIEQLKGSFCVYKYCECVLKEFFQETFFSNYKLRFIACLHTHSAKRKTAVDRSSHPIHNKPEKLLKVSYAKEIQFNKIASLGAG